MAMTKAAPRQYPEGQKTLMAVVAEKTPIKRIPSRVQNAVIRVHMLRHS